MMITFFLVVPIIFARAQDYASNPIFKYVSYQPAVTEYANTYLPLGKARQSPQVWWDHHSFLPKELEERQFYPGKDLQELFKIGLGPRRKRRDSPASQRTFDTANKIVQKTIQQLMDMPLFCWKIYVNCAVFPKHVCCPVMYKKKPKPKKKKSNLKLSKREVDPLFGVPIVPQKRNDIEDPENTKHYQEWRPYSPYYIGLPGYEKPPPIVVKRCLTTDLSACHANPKNPCCSKYLINRFFPIGPYVQPTLVENWVSALFEFSGQNPVAFTWIKTVTIVTVVSLLTILWGLLGAYLGVIDTKNVKDEMANRSDHVESIVFNSLAKGENWLEKLQDYVEKHQTLKDVHSFMCCITNRNDLKCASVKSSKMKKKLSASKLGCLAELMYKVDLDT